MPRPNKTGKPSPAKAPARRRGKRANPLLDLLKNLDDEVLAMLQQSMAEEMGLGAEGSPEPDPVELFGHYLESCRLAEIDEAEKNDRLSDLVEALSDLRIEAGGGRRDARERIRAIYDLLEGAIEKRALPIVDLMIIAKVFADSGLEVPGSLKRSVAEALELGPPDSLDGGDGSDLVTSLLEDPELADKNPSDVYETLNSLTVGLPAQPVIALLRELVAGGKAVVDEAAAGFALHPDPEIARAVVEALAASAVRAPVASALIERLVRMRPWLPPARQMPLDEAIRAMRMNAAPPVKSELPNIGKCMVSVCDGSGTRSLVVTLRAGERHLIATVMMKREGIDDAMMLRDLSRPEMNDIVRRMKSSLLTAETDLAGVVRTLGLAVAENFASGRLPPFKLVDLAETLGLGPIYPDPATPHEIIAGLLAGLPAGQTDAAAAAKAHLDILKNEFEYQWFETGEPVEDMLYPVEGFKQRVAKLMKSYLPERRGFWTRQCALSALALRNEQKSPHAMWKQLALVGRDIGSDRPLERIPLMKQIARVSVEAFESQP
ncbi:MAG: hypothetical protein ABR970_10320 [Roseiarcus sp.]|jgi:hypothetical protein